MSDNVINEYKLIKSKRRSFEIGVKPTGEVILRVPHKATKKQINDFTHKHQEWLQGKLQEIYKVLQVQQKSTTSLYFLGNKYLIKESNAHLNLVQFTGSEFLIKQGLLDKIDTLLPSWYAVKAKEIINPIIQKYMQDFNLQYTTLKITSARSRWGSCGSNGSICFSYRIAMLPLEVINYIVAHELAHLKHFNHSKSFWSEVQLMCPNYKSANQWLKDNKIALAVQII